MLGLFVRAIRKHGPPDAIYLDNGSTYRGHTLALACARGWGLPSCTQSPTTRRRAEKWSASGAPCGSDASTSAGTLGSLHDLNVRLYAFLDEHYHRTPTGPSWVKPPRPCVHGCGATRRLRRKETPRCPHRPRSPARARRLHRPHGRRRLGDRPGLLARRLVTVSRCMVDPAEPPWIEHEGVRHVLQPVDPRKNAHRKRAPVCLDKPHEARTSFDPPKALLDKSVGRAPKPAGSKEAT